MSEPFDIQLAADLRAIRNWAVGVRRTRFGYGAEDVLVDKLTLLGSAVQLGLLLSRRDGRNDFEIGSYASCSIKDVVNTALKRNNLVAQPIEILVNRNSSKMLVRCIVEVQSYSELGKMYVAELADNGSVDVTQAFYQPAEERDLPENALAVVLLLPHSAAYIQNPLRLEKQESSLLSGSPWSFYHSYFSSWHAVSDNSCTEVNKQPFTIQVAQSFIKAFRQVQAVERSSPFRLSNAMPAATGYALEPDLNPITRAGSRPGNGEVESSGKAVSDFQVVIKRVDEQFDKEDLRNSKITLGIIADDLTDEQQLSGLRDAIGRIRSFQKQQGVVFWQSIHVIGRGAHFSEAYPTRSEASENIRLSLFKQGVVFHELASAGITYEGFGTYLRDSLSPFRSRIDLEPSQPIDGSKSPNWRDPDPFFVSSFAD